MRLAGARQEAVFGDVSGPGTARFRRDVRLFRIDEETLQIELPATSRSKNGDARD
jgi:hypothetical protein